MKPTETITHIGNILYNKLLLITSNLFPSSPTNECNVDKLNRHKSLYKLQQFLNTAISITPKNTIHIHVDQ